MRKYIFILSVTFLLIACRESRKEMKLTGINPTSYTSVSYISKRDTVLATTYSGRIDKVIKNGEKETFVQLDDEIYGISYIPGKNAIAVTTMENGILVLDLKTRKIIKQLDVKNFWALWVNNNRNFLFARDWNGVAHIWDIQKDYEEVNLSEEVSGLILANVGSLQDEVLFLSQSGETSLFNLSTGNITEKMKTGYRGIVDIDKDRKLLMLMKNECFLYNPDLGETTIAVKHPNYPVRNSDGDLFGEEPVSMTISKARFFGSNYFVTGGIDKSLRVWDKTSGELMQTLLLHHASVSGIDINDSHSQMVSVDLKGGIYFTESDQISENDN